MAGALSVDWGGTYLTSRQGNRRIHSAAHWTERYGLFVILAIGESAVAIGVGAAGQPISASLLAAAALGVAAALYGGFALHLAGRLLFEQRVHAALGVPRLVAVGVLLAALPAAAFLPLLAGLVLPLGALIGVETRRYAPLGAVVRPG